jgi:predicted GIY-YIG superfamily endonuclease
MNAHFAKIVDSLQPTLQRLLAMDPVKVDLLPRSMPEEGVYLLSEGETHLYVGRSRRIRKRIASHSQPGGSHKGAAFAFRLAREMTDQLDPTYKTEGSRDSLMRDPAFRQAFENAKARIRGMELRYSEESDPIRQSLLEIYVAVSLQTPYNSFRTH